MRRYIHGGQEAAWRHMERVKNLVARERLIEWKSKLQALDEVKNMVTVNSIDNILAARLNGSFSSRERTAFPT
jgi:hypothetical protein